MIYKLKKNELIINHECRKFCTIPYHGHKNGCPNHNKSLSCPPKAHLIEEFIDLNKQMWFVIEEFDLKNHIEKMKIKHPEWTLIQLKNLLYWQGGVRKRLREKTELFILKNDSEMIYTLLPEAMGVMVIDTAQKLGIPIQKHPTNSIFKISLVGYRKQPEDKYEEVRI